MTEEELAYQKAAWKNKLAAELLDEMISQGVTHSDSVSNRVSIAVTSMHAAEVLAMAQFKRSLTSGER